MKLNPTLEKLDGGMHIEGPLVVGDPCYFYSSDDNHDEWCELCDLLASEESMGSNDNCTFGAKINVLDESFFIISTNYGDGVYPVIKNNKQIDSLPVDAGLLSVMSESLYNKLSSRSGKNPKKLLAKINIPGAVISPRKIKGDFNIGDNIKVITSFHKDELEGVKLNDELDGY